MLTKIIWSRTVLFIKMNLALNNLQLLTLLRSTHSHNDINHKRNTINKFRYSQIHNSNTCTNVCGLCCSCMNGLLTSDFGSSTRGERHNSYYADHTIWPHKRAAYPVMFKISVGRNPKKKTTTSSMVKIQLSTSDSMAGTQLSACMVQCQSSTDSFTKYSNSQDHLFRTWRHPHSSPISCLEVYYDNGDCHILCARA